jgi:hypothetical protein
VNVNEADRRVLHKAFRYLIKWKMSVLDSCRGCEDDVELKKHMDHSNKNIEEFRSVVEKLSKRR